MSIIFYSHYMYLLSFKLFFKIIKLINKFNTKFHLISIFLIKKIRKTVFNFTLFLKIVSKEQKPNIV